jgi:hypothetical protein
MLMPLRSIAGLGAVGLLTLAVVPSNAAPRAERELLGIRIWNRFSDVLRLHGQPTRIENGLVSSSADGGQTVGAGAPGGGGFAGAPGMSGRPGMPGMGGMPGMMGSGGPMGGKMGAMGMPGMGGSGGRMGGMTTGMGMPGMPGSGGGMGRMGAMGIGAEGGPGMPGMGGAGGGIGIQGDQSDEARQTWIYQHGAITNFFVFNKDGRVVQIESSGLSGTGGVTARGIKLGDPVAKVYRAYGWTGKVSRNGSATLLDYTRESHAAFTVQDEKGRGPVVVDIAVTLLDVGPPNPLGSGSSIAGGPGMPGMGGMPGMPGMGGMPRMGGMMGSGGPMGGKMGAMGMPGATGGMGAPGRGKFGGMGAEK